VWGESVKAIVVLRDGTAPTEESIIRFCEGKVAGYKKPKSVDFVSKLPRNPSGKVLKTELRAMYWRDQETKI
jgi:fatty-acyl-CoA synthase/long-chain acyl-CoA synthetase